MMLEITMLPARQGDALWIRWGRENEPHLMIIDMGTEETGKQVRKAIEKLPPAQRKLDLLVVTHVDRDHIGGVLTCLAEADPLPGLEISDVWFNGWVHLNGGSIDQLQPGGGNSGLEPMGPAQGERLSSWLRQQVWNRAFDGGPIQRVAGKPLKKVVLHDGLTLTVLGPTPDRLSGFIGKWKEDVEEALEKGSLTEVSPGLEPLGPADPPDLEDRSDLKALADTNNPPDRAHANGSSISLLLEYKKRSIILSGDAFPDDLLAGINAVNNGQRLRIDAFKLPHHGSRNNVMRALVESVECERWLFSTDGSIFRHPDPPAIARVLTFSHTSNPILSFNVPSTFNGWWNNTGWKDMFGYTTEYGTKEAGLTIAFDAEQ